MDRMQMNNLVFWILDFALLYVAARIASEVNKLIPLSKTRWELYIEDDRLLFKNGSRISEFAVQDISEVNHYEERSYRRFTGADWDKLVVKVNGKKELSFLARPDEPERETTEKELHKIAMIIIEAADLRKDEDQLFDTVETFIRKQD